MAVKCRWCREILDPELRKQQARPSSVDAAIMPVGRSGWAVVAGYFGLFSLFPVVGILSILISVAAFRELKAKPELLGTGRAWFGMVMGILTTVLWALMFAFAGKW